MLHARLKILLDLLPRATHEAEILVQPIHLVSSRYTSVCLRIEPAWSCIISNLQRRTNMKGYTIVVSYGTDVERTCYESKEVWPTLEDIEIHVPAWKEEFSRKYVNVTVDICCLADIEEVASSNAFGNYKQ